MLYTKMGKAHFSGRDIFVPYNPLKLPTYYVGD